MLENLVKKNRSYRKFKEQKGISNKIIKDIINLARLSCECQIIMEKRCSTIFPNII